MTVELHDLHGFDIKRANWDSRPKTRQASQELAFFTPMPNAPARKRSGHQWQKIRLRIMARDYGLCQECKRQGRHVIGSEVDHILPIFKGGTDDEDNLQFLCRRCHEVKTAADTGRRLSVEIGFDGYPIEDRPGGGSNL